jgi:release factor glutamine methyltransferase
MDAATAIATAADLLRAATVRLSAAHIATARLDAEVLLALAMKTDRTGLYARLSHPVTPQVEERFVACVDRRARREPIAYITGVQEFWSLPYTVSRDVLIPRPETELLVETVIRLVKSCGGAEVRRCGGNSKLASEFPNHLRTSAPPHLRTSSWSICDVGTGSGCLAVTLAHELPGARVTAIDTSAAALAVAARNAAAHGVGDRIVFTQCDLFDALDPGVCFDVIVSNPPYCRPGDLLSPEVAFEPSSAVAAGADGLGVIRRLLAAAPARLRPRGWLVMEFGQGQDAQVTRLAREAGLADIEINTDLAGIPRALIARQGGPI